MAVAELARGLWRASNRLLIVAQLDRINWSSAFDRLDVKLNNGNNTVINSLIGTTPPEDSIPMFWDNTVVYRLGTEYRLSPHTQVRAGYSFGKSPVPDDTLTPMTAAIMEQTLSLGLGHQVDRVRFDVAYQVDLPVTRRVDDSILRSGEYDGSEISVAIQWVAITASIRF